MEQIFCFLPRPTVFSVRTNLSHVPKDCHSRTQVTHVRTEFCGHSLIRVTF